MLLPSTAAGQAATSLSGSAIGKSNFSCPSVAKPLIGSLHTTPKRREAASPGDETHICRNVLKPTDHQSSPFAELGVWEIWDGIGRTRVRQHVNPLCIQYQKPTGPLDWNSMFSDPSRPLVVDVGCGPGRFLLLMHHRHTCQLQMQQQQQQQPHSQQASNGTLHAHASNEQQAQPNGFHHAQTNSGQKAQPSNNQHAPSSRATQHYGGYGGGLFLPENQVRQAVGLTSRGAALEPMNYLGLEIRHPLVDRANSWATRLGCRQEVKFVNTNATISLATMLSSYPGPVRLVCIQFPDPHFKRRNHKRRIFQPNLVKDVASVLEPGGCIFLQSDVEEVSVAMRNVFEHQGAAFFDVAPEHHQPEATFFSAPGPESKQDNDKNSSGSKGASQAPFQGAHQHIVGMQSIQQGSEAAWEGDGEQGCREYSDGEDEEQQGDGRGWKNSEGGWEGMESKWAEAGWLKDNPVGVPTEREFYVEQQQLPVYRMLLNRK